MFVQQKRDVRVFSRAVAASEKGFKALFALHSFMECVECLACLGLHLGHIAPGSPGICGCYVKCDFP